MVFEQDFFCFFLLKTWWFFVYFLLFYIYILHLLWSTPKSGFWVCFTNEYDLFQHALHVYNGPCNENIILTVSGLLYRKAVLRDQSYTYSSDIHSSVCQRKRWEWWWELAGCSAPSHHDIKGSVWEYGAWAHTSWPCGPDSHSLITARPARLSWDTPWTLHRTDRGLLNMQQS